MSLGIASKGYVTVRRTSSTYSPLARFRVLDPWGGVLLEALEADCSMWKKVLKVTVWRMALGIRLPVRDVRGAIIFELKRSPGLWRSDYDLVNQEGSVIARVKDRSFLGLSRDIVDGTCATIGEVRRLEWFAKKEYRSDVIDVWGSKVATFAWNKAIWRRPSECRLELANPFMDPMWEAISLAACLIMGLALDKR